MSRLYYLIACSSFEHRNEFICNKKGYKRGEKSNRWKITKEKRYEHSNSRSMSLDSWRRDPWSTMITASFSPSICSTLPATLFLWFKSNFVERTQLFKIVLGKLTNLVVTWLSRILTRSLLELVPLTVTKPKSEPLKLWFYVSNDKELNKLVNFLPSRQITTRLLLTRKMLGNSTNIYIHVLCFGRLPVPNNPV